jgi:hypothetical protein
MNNLMVRVTESSHANGYSFFELACGKQSISVSVGPMGVRALVLNASHRAWRGIGKSFETFAAAREHYRSPGVRAMLDTAEQLSGCAQVAA